MTFDLSAYYDGQVAHRAYLANLVQDYNQYNFVDTFLAQNAKDAIRDVAGEPTYTISMNIANQITLIEFQFEDVQTDPLLSMVSNFDVKQNNAFMFEENSMSLVANSFNLNNLSYAFEQVDDGVRIRNTHSLVLSFY